ncbi:hypothetical protein LTR50_006856 [Elasticomyces elasticus]|nr:hypothetical protein LTR50_006856 [Elasticomyces elasticus]
MTPRSAVIVPLYIYPLTPETWQPLYRAISTHPTLPFLIILNPDSGPGAPGSPSPDANYARETARLNAYPNVTTLGYVRVDYCRRGLGSVVGDVGGYAKWAGVGGGGGGLEGGGGGGSVEGGGGGVFVRGIFVDETPNLYTPHVAAYLDALNVRIKNSAGILGERIGG